MSGVSDVISHFVAGVLCCLQGHACFVSGPRTSMYRPLFRGPYGFLFDTTIPIVGVFILRKKEERIYLLMQVYSWKGKRGV